MQNIIDSVHTSNKDTYRSDCHHQISVRCYRLRSYMATGTVAYVLGFLTISEKQKQKQKGKILFCNCWFNSAVSLTLASTKDRFLCHAITKNWKPSSGRYKRLIYKQFVQLSGLCGPQFHAETFHAPLWSFVWRRHTGVPFWSTKTSGVHFSYKSSFLSLEN